MPEQKASDTERTWTIWACPRCGEDIGERTAHWHPHPDSLDPEEYFSEPVTVVSLDAMEREKEKAATARERRKQETARADANAFQIKVERERLQKEKAEREAAIQKFEELADQAEEVERRLRGKAETSDDEVSHIAAAEIEQGRSLAYSFAAEYLRSLADEPNREESRDAS